MSCISKLPNLIVIILLVIIIIIFGIIHRIENQKKPKEILIEDISKSFIVNPNTLYIIKHYNNIKHDINIKFFSFLQYKEIFPDCAIDKHYIYLNWNSGFDHIKIEMSNTSKSMRLQYSQDLVNYYEK